MRKTLLAVAVLVVTVGACGGNSTNDFATPGAKLYAQRGCSGCHGTNAEGQVGPTLVGLFGSEVTIEGDPDYTVVADRDYLRESILDPKAKVVKDKNLPMPPGKFSDQELEQLLDHLESLGKPAGATTDTTGSTNS